MDVVAEGLREDLKVVIDKTVATGKKVDRLIASNAIEHAAFQEFIARPGGGVADEAGAHFAGIRMTFT